MEKMNERKQEMSLAPLVSIVVISIMTGCMMTAAARNDFSQMGNDYFSTLIKNSIPENFGPHGFEGIRRDMVIAEGRRYFSGKEEKEVLSIFHASGDKCEPSNLSVGMNYGGPLVCGASRKWALKNIGYPSFGVFKDIPSYWPEPGAKLIFRFLLSPNKTIDSTEIDIVDITVRKNVY